MLHITIKQRNYYYFIHNLEFYLTKYLYTLPLRICNYLKTIYLCRVLFFAFTSRILQIRSCELDCALRLLNYALRLCRCWLKTAVLQRAQDRGRFSRPSRLSRANGLRNPASGDLSRANGPHLDYFFSQIIHIIIYFTQHPKVTTCYIYYCPFILVLLVIYSNIIFTESICFMQ